MLTGEVLTVLLWCWQDTFPKSQVDVYVTVLENDGGGRQNLLQTFFVFRVCYEHWPDARTDQCSSSIFVSVWERIGICACEFVCV